VAPEPCQRSARIWKHDQRDASAEPVASVTDVDLAPLVADPAARGDHRRPIVGGVVELLQAAIRASGGRIQRRGGLHVEGLVRPLIVVAVHELIEARLLLEHIDRGAPRRIGFQGEVQPLVRPFCSGWPGAQRSSRMPSRSHQTASLLSPR
jgi:hypothetical protein